MTFKKGLSFFIFMAIAIGIFVFFYFNYEKPVIDVSAEIVNVSIYAVDSDNGEMVKTNYSIFNNKYLIENGTTSEDYPIIKRFNKESSIKIISESKDYYNDEVLINSGINNLSRAKLEMVSPGELTIEENNDVLFQDSAKFKILSDGEIRNLIVCVKWSRNFLWIKGDFPLLENEVSLYNKCFITGISLDKTNSSANLEFDYKSWGLLSSGDSMEFTFIDSENLKTGMENDKDYWAENKKVVLKV